VDWTNLSTFIANCFSYDLDRDACELLKQIIDDFKALNGTKFHEILLHFLQRVAPAWADSTLTSSPAYQALFQDTLHRYLIRYVQPEPEAPGMVRRPIQCSLATTCMPCKKINAFLQNPKLTRSPELEVSDLEYEHVNVALNVPCASDIKITVQRGFKVKFIKLTKITKQYEKRHGEWMERRRNAEGKMRAIGEEVLMKMLGDKFGDIVRMRCVRLEPKGTVKKRNGVMAKGATSIPSQVEPVEENSDNNPHRQVNPSRTHTPARPSDQVIKPHHYTAAREVVQTKLREKPRVPHDDARRQPDAYEPF
jgi:hypothetical protein